MNSTTVLKSKGNRNTSSLLPYLIIAIVISVALGPMARSAPAAVAATIAPDTVLQASNVDIVPTVVRGGAVFALLTNASSATQVPVPIYGATASHGISAGILLYSVREELWGIDLATGNRWRAIPGASIASAAWKPGSHTFAAIVRTPDGMSLVTASADNAMIDVTEAADIRPEFLRWSHDGETLFYLMEKERSAARLVLRDSREVRRSAPVPAWAIPYLGAASDDTLRSLRVADDAATWIQQSLPLPVARSDGGVFTESSNGLEFRTNGNTTALHVVPSAIVSTSLPAGFGDYLSEFQGVVIHSNGYADFVSNLRSIYNGVDIGMEWQCVEFVNRYYLQIYHVNLRSYASINANDFFRYASTLRLDAYANGSSTPPDTGDIIVSEGGSSGHVGIVSRRTSSSVCLAQQNWVNSNYTEKCVNLTLSGSSYRMADLNATFPVKGWLRNRSSASSTPARIQSPASGSTLSGATQTFTWNAAQGASAYWLYVGTSPAGNDLYSQNVGTSLSATVTALPTNGATIYTRLWTLINGVWQPSDAQFKAATINKVVAATIQSPTPGSTLSGSTQTFSWNQTGASGYQLYVGTTSGGSDLFAQNVGTNTSATATSLPTNGSTIYTRLWSLINGSWQPSDAQFKAASSGGVVTVAKISSPAPASTLSGSTQTFLWGAVQDASSYLLYVGSSVGSYNFYSQNLGTLTSATVTNLPTNGSTIYTRLWTLRAGVWNYSDAQFKAAASSGGGTSLAQMISPANGSTLSGSTQTFTWTRGQGDEIYFYLGTSTGTSNLFGASMGTSASVTLSNLPKNGIALYVRLFTHINGSWQYLDYRYTAAR
jgi:hypothetical protein